MSKLRKLIGRWKVITVSTAMAIAAFWLAPFDFIASVSGELINFFGFVIAAVLPAMALTATSLRGSGMSIKRLLQLRDALDKQMNFWAGLVIVSFFAVAFVVFFKTIVGCNQNSPCRPFVLYEYGGYSFDTRWANALLAYIFSLIFLQLANVLRGLRGLLAVNAEAALGEAQQRFNDMMEETAREIANIRNPPGYGETIELPDEENR